MRVGQARAAAAALLICLAGAAHALDPKAVEQLAEIARRCGTECEDYTALAAAIAR